MTIVVVIILAWQAGWLLYMGGAAARERWQGRHARREAHRRRVRMRRPYWWLEDES